jgi:hypothetical protein
VDKMSMDPMNEDARRLVARARDERTPGELDKARVRKAVAMGIAAAALGASSTVAGAAVAKAAGVASVGTGLKVLASVVVVALGVGTYVWTQQRVPAPVPAVKGAARSPRIEVVPIAPLPAAEAPAPRPAVHARPARPTPDPLVAELALLHRAQQAWHDGQAASALDLARRHAQLYPHSQLALERGALQVFALCALGRKSEARGLASGLLAQAPRSPLRTSLEESCAVH